MTQPKSFGLTVQSTDLVIIAVGASLIVLFIGAGVILALNHSVPTEFWAAAGALSGALIGILVPSSPDAKASGDPVMKTASTHVHNGAIGAAGGRVAQYPPGTAQRAAAEQALDEVKRQTTSLHDLRLAAGGTAPATSMAAAAAAVMAEGHRAAATQASGARRTAEERLAQQEATLDRARASGATDEVAAAQDRVREAQSASDLAAVRENVFEGAAQGAQTSQAAATSAGAAMAPRDGAPRHAGSHSTALKVAVLVFVGTLAFVAGTVLATEVSTTASASAYDKAVTNAADALIALGAGAGGAIIGLLAPSPVKPSGAGQG